MAESCTGGLVASMVTDVSGASEVFVGGVVAYARQLKEDLLGVEAATLDEHGEVSAEAAQAMSEAAHARFGATWALATTGYASPPGDDEDSVGTVYVAVTGADGTTVERHTAEHVFEDDRVEMKVRFAELAIGDLLERLKED